MTAPWGRRPSRRLSALASVLVLAATVLALGTATAQAVSVPPGCKWSGRLCVYDGYYFSGVNRVFTCSALRSGRAVQSTVLTRPDGNLGLPSSLYNGCNFPVYLSGGEGFSSGPAAGPTLEVAAGKRIGDLRYHNCANAGGWVSCTNVFRVAVRSFS